VIATNNSVEYEHMNLILNKFPEFTSVWQEHLKFWGEDEAGLSNDMTEFASFVIRNTEKMPNQKRREIFLFC
jgi:hypothetical protein